jgi:hypothetical protein
MTDARKLDQPRRRDVRSRIARDLQRDDLVLGSAQDERRDAHCRENVPDVDLLVHPVQRLERARARAVPEHLEEILRLVVAELSERPNRFASLFARTENAQVARDFLLVLLLRPAPRIVGRPHPPRKGAPDDERRSPLGIRGREEDRHRGPFRKAVEGSPPRADGVHHRANVVHARLERRRSADRIGHARASLVEPDQPAERAQSLEKRGKGQHLPVELEVRHVPGYEHEVERALAADLIGDVHVAALRVADFRHFHAESVAGRRGGDKRVGR